MSDREVTDYSGNWDWEDEDDDLGFLSDDEAEFLDASESAEDFELEYGSFFSAILTGVTLSHNLNKKINLLIEESAISSFEKSKTIQGEIVEMSKKMFAANKTINELIIKTYEFCEKEKKFWHNSSLDVYKQYFPVLKENYKVKYPESEEIDFLKNEYHYFLCEDINGLNTIHNTIGSDDKLKVVDYVSRLNIDNEEFFNVNRQRKLDFVRDEIAKSGFIIEVSKKKK